MKEKTLNTGYKEEKVNKKPRRYKPAQVASKIKLTTYVTYFHNMNGEQ